MESLSNEGYGQVIKGRFYKNPNVTDTQLSGYHIQRRQFWMRYHSSKGNFGASVKMLNVAEDIHKALYPW